MAECANPFTLKDTAQQVPCGKCYNCRSRRISGWSFRLMQEDKTAITSWFITLTYAPEHIKRSKNGFATLHKRDIQLFWKRLRKTQTNTYGYSHIKYYAVGEYGGQFGRPHYHAICFNADEQLIDKAWGLGSVHFGQVSNASVGYTLKYMFKPPTNKRHSRDDRTPEFGCMSKGLGANYLSPKMVSWHMKDAENRLYLNLTDGKKIAMPRYYKLKMYDDETRKKIGEATRKRMLLKQQSEELREAQLSPKHKQISILTDANRMALRSFKADRL